MTPLPDPPPSSTPTAEDVRAMVRATNIRTVLGGALLLILVAGVVWYTAESRSAALDSNSSTKVALANNARAACIDERRAVQVEAAERANIEANRAEAAGLLDDDLATAQEHRRLHDEWVQRWFDATDALEPDVLNQPPPVGCGPVIDDVEAIPAPVDD